MSEVQAAPAKRGPKQSPLAAPAADPMEAPVETEANATPPGEADSDGKINFPKVAKKPESSHPKAERPVNKFVPPKDKHGSKLQQSHIHLSAEVQRFITIKPPAGVTPKDVMRPNFWDNVLRGNRVTISPMDEVRVMPQDGAWYGVFLITFVGRGETRVEQLFFKELYNISPSAMETSKYKVHFHSPAFKWCVTRKRDGVLMGKDYATPEAAIRRMAILTPED